MGIWSIQDVSIAQLNEMCKGNLGENLGIEFTEIGDDFIKATMPVNHQTKQPFGLLHGGASAALAETLGSVASYLCVDVSKKNTVGLEINCNHLRSVKGGVVTGITRPIHLGKSTQVWDIKIMDDRDRLICISRLTVAVINK